MNIWLRILKHPLQYNKKIGIQENIFNMARVLRTGEKLSESLKIVSIWKVTAIFY